jgi:hypothetical protein
MKRLEMIRDHTMKLTDDEGLEYREVSEEDFLWLVREVDRLEERCLSARWLLGRCGPPDIRLVDVGKYLTDLRKWLGGEP